MIDKIEDFLYDLLALVIPGIILIILSIIPPFLFINLNKYNLEDYATDKTFASNALVNIINKIKFEDITSIYVVFAIILLSYILGHAIKVFSKYQYEFFAAIFDNGINRFIRWIIENLSSIKYVPFSFLKREYRKELIEQNRWYVGIINIPIGVIHFFSKLIHDIFSFTSPSYYTANEPLQTDVIKKLNSKYNTNFPDNWYSVYKISNVIMAQENLKSMSSKFLAKYNFYRSMAFLFFLNSIYNIIFFNTYKFSITTLGHDLYKLICAVSAIFWLTFHEKFKRYWTLCGNESLVSLFYYLSKPLKYNKEENKNG